MRHPHYLDADADFTLALDGLVPISAAPSTVLLNQGLVVAVHVGPFREAQEVLEGLAFLDARELDAAQKKDK